MKHAKWFLLAALLMLLPGAETVVAKNRATPVRVVTLQNQMLYALDQGNDKQMIRLLQQGADPKTHDKDGFSVFDYAVVQTDYPLLHALFRAGLNLKKQDSGAGTELMDVITLCGGCGCTTDDKMAEFLLTYGAPVNYSQNGRTPLLDSAKMLTYAPNENMRLIPILLRYGANAAKRDEKGHTAYEIVRSTTVEENQQKQRQHILALLKSAMRKHRTKS